ncbi:helix-turn-helix domain-containing protein, partial [Glycomyces tenuis]
MRARDTVEGAGESLAEFVAALRQLRQLAGRPTYEQMSEGGPYSGSALCRAQAGRRVPTWGVTSAFVRACGGDGDWWFEQYQKLIDALQTGQRVEFTPQNPHGFPGLHVPLWALAPRQIRGITEFSWYMKMIWRQSGLTFTEIAARTAEPGIAAAIDKPGGIAISTLSDLCNPKCTRIPTWRTLCG